VVVVSEIRAGDTVLDGGGENEAGEGAERLWADPAHVPLWEWRKRSS